MPRCSAGRSNRSTLPAPAVQFHDDRGKRKREHTMIVVTGSVTAREDSLGEVRKLSLEHVHRSRREPGCISHAVHLDCENPLRLGFIEQGTDPPALLGQFSVPAFPNFFAAAPDAATAA